MDAGVLQLDSGEISALQSSGKNHLHCIANHQWNATQYNFLQLVLEPVVFSDWELADVFSSGVEVM
jgi:hypothetical protein